MKIDGKVVLITGASEGIGAACAAVFRTRGARLALLARDERKLRAVAGPDGLAIVADLTDPEAPGRAVAQTVKRYGAVDILINNAGVGLYTPVLDAPMAQTRAMFELNLFSVLAMIQSAAEVMRRQGGGTIVNVSSIAGKVTLPWLTLYSAAKHAVCALTEGSRMELAADGIHAISICPGYVNTRFQENVLAGTPPAALRRRRPLSISAERCALAIARGVERNARTVVTPLSGWLFICAARVLPGVVERQLERMYRQQ